MWWLVISYRQFTSRNVRSARVTICVGICNIAPRQLRPTICATSYCPHPHSVNIRTDRATTPAAYGLTCDSGKMLLFRAAV